MHMGAYLPTVALGDLNKHIIPVFSAFPLRLCGEELELEISMDASGTEDAMGIERTLQLLVDGE
jgi:hypothetical protein